MASYLARQRAAKLGSIDLMPRVKDIAMNIGI